MTRKVIATAQSPKHMIFHHHFTCEIMTSPVSNSIACVECHKVVKLAEIYHCHTCSDPYCSSCQVDHCKGRHANRGTPYEIYQQVEEVLATEQDESLRRQMHDCDSLARWIGITMPDNITNAQPSLWGYSRIADLLTDNRDPEIQCPSLVSFIGRTGSRRALHCGRAVPAR